MVHLYILKFFFQTWCIPLHTGSLVYYLAFPPLFLYEEDSTNSSYHVLLQVFVYKYHKDIHKDCDIYTQRLEGLLINLNFQETDWAQAREKLNSLGHNYCQRII